MDLTKLSLSHTKIPSFAGDFGIKLQLVTQARSRARAVSNYGEKIIELGIGSQAFGIDIGAIEVSTA
jgi:hypothetical protein